MKSFYSFLCDIIQQRGVIVLNGIPQSRRQEYADAMITSFLSNPQLRYACQISLFQLLEVYVVVQIESLFPAISSQLLDVLPSHTSPKEVSAEPMPAAVRAKVVLKPL